MSLCCLSGCQNRWERKRIFTQYTLSEGRSIPWQILLSYKTSSASSCAFRQQNATTVTQEDMNIMRIAEPVSVRMRDTVYFRKKPIADDGNSKNTQSRILTRAECYFLAIPLSLVLVWILDGAEVFYHTVHLEQDHQWLVTRTLSTEGQGHFHYEDWLAKATCNTEIDRQTLVFNFLLKSLRNEKRCIRLWIAVNRLCIVYSVTDTHAFSTHGFPHQLYLHNRWDTSRAFVCPRRKCLSKRSFPMHLVYSRGEQ